MNTGRNAGLRNVTLSVLPLLFAGILVGCGSYDPGPSTTFNAELEYLKVVNEHGPAADARVIFLLMGQYLSANRTAEGIAFYESMLDEFGGDLEPPQRALYQSAMALLRASHAGKIPFTKRIGWVNDTIDILENARELSGDGIFVVHWIQGMAYTRFPRLFGMKETAATDLQWCVDHAEDAPGPGWMRDVYFNQGMLADKNSGEAGRLLKLSGYESFDKEIVINADYSISAETGFNFAQRQLKEVVPGKVFVLSGFEFTEYYFIVSEGGRELIGIDAGTRPDSAKEAYEYLREKKPGLPPLTTIFVTHAHWDHIGGHRYFREIAPNLLYYGRDNYAVELQRCLDTPGMFGYFLGSKFDLSEIADYKPDVEISVETTVAIDGTEFRLIPISGGETSDGIFVHLPQHSVLFVGDFTMPFFGAPFVEEGEISGYFETVDLLLEINADHVLHGHYALTLNFNPPERLGELSRMLQWLREEVLENIRAGKGRPAIHHLNLIPPFIHEYPETQVMFLVLRENFINRLYDQNVGYWHPDTTGMDSLSPAELGSVLTDYLELSDAEIETLIQTMIERGDLELAARTVTAAIAQNPENKDLTDVKVRAYSKLIEKYQLINPFKYIIYSDRIGRETPPLQHE